jgi:uncharacterized Zn finger protein (UPF0148 family)
MIDSFGCPQCEKAAEEAAEEAARAERETARLAEYEIRWNERLPMRMAILDAAKALGHQAELTDRKMLIDGIQVDYWISIDEAYNEISAWRRARIPGVFNIVVDGVGSQKRKAYRQRAAGGHDYDAIVQRLLGHIEEQKRTAHVRSVQDVNCGIVDSFRKEVNITSWSSPSLNGSQSAERPVTFKFSLNADVTVDRAREIVAGLRALGLIK